MTSRRTILALACWAVGALFAPVAAQANNYCGAASYNCCPTAACAPTACYTTCRVERETCYRTVYDTVQEPQRIAQVTLARGVGADQHGQGSQ